VEVDLCAEFGGEGGEGTGFGGVLWVDRKEVCFVQYRLADLRGEGGGAFEFLRRG
jgi:hypothetical protein